MYDIRTDVQYGPLEKVELGALADAAPSKWWLGLRSEASEPTGSAGVDRRTSSTVAPRNLHQSLVNVNDGVVRVGVFEGEFHWHKHDKEDECTLRAASAT